MGIFEKLLGWKKGKYNKQQNSSNKTVRQLEQFFPIVLKEHLHTNFGEFDESPPSDPNAPRLSEGAPFYNNKDYENAYKIIMAALNANPNENEKSVAYALIGMIEIKRGNLLAAINNFLSCLKAHKRERMHSWQSAMHLYYIYSEAGLLDTAKELQRLSMLAIGQNNFTHSPEAEKEVRELTRHTLDLLRADSTEPDKRDCVQITCSQCNEIFNIGVDSFLVTADDVKNFATDQGSTYVRIGKGMTQAPALAMRFKTRSANEEERAQELRKISQICKAIKKGETRNWRCEKCHTVNHYFPVMHRA